MRKRAIIYNIIFILILGLLWPGCAKKSAVIEEVPLTDESETYEITRFDPLELPADREIVPLKYPHTGSFSNPFVSVEPNTITTDSIEVFVEDVPDVVDTVYNQAYRVQIFTTKVYGEARYALKIAEEIFDRLVTIDYEVPYFKVRVGRFSNREEAEEYSMKVKAAGYTNAWVVMVNVNVKQAAPLYEEESPFPEEVDTLYYEENPVTEDDG